jgi:hypothetical protein
MLLAMIPSLESFAFKLDAHQPLQESVIASTNPNRVTWASGSINVPGSPQTPKVETLTLTITKRRVRTLPVAYQSS